MVREYSEEGPPRDDFGSTIGGTTIGALEADGPQRAEAWLLARLDACADAARRDPARLATPVRVVVP
ncbi:MAG: hypothetical protein AAF772_15375, partial [Acidobacteriota bacterium]